MLKRLALGCTIAVLSAPAFGADLPSSKGPPVYVPPPPPIFSWTGVYVGAQLGYAWAPTSSTIYNATTGNALVSPLSPKPDGIIGGGHLGYNYQLSQFVLGLEGDFEDSSLNSAIWDGDTAISTRVGIQGSVRGRVGYAWDRVLIYATGGLAIANISEGDSYISSANGSSYYDLFHRGALGWTVGGGVEYAIDNNWSVRAEFRHSDYGSFNDYLTQGGANAFVRQHVTENQAEAGVSYKFDFAPLPAPIVSKY